MATARSVVDGDPDLYFDIQQLNPHRGEREQIREQLRTARQLLQVG